MGKNISFNRLIRLRNEILELGGFFCRPPVGHPFQNGKPIFRTNREMLDFLWNLRVQTFEACAANGSHPGWWAHLQKTYSEWESVRNALAAQYMPLVHSVARKYGHPNQDFSDLIQEGAKGMLRALDSFEVEYNVPFEVYARPWIRKYLGKCVECDSEIIRVPESSAKRRRAQHRVGVESATFSFSNSCNPVFVSDQEVADKRENHEQRFSRQETVRFLNQCVSNLDVNAQKVLRLHYASRKTPSLEYVGEKCGFSREKTRKIQQKALKTLAKKLKTVL